MKKLCKTWVALTPDLLKKYNISKRQLYKRIALGDWRDGFVVKRGTNSNRYKFFCMEDYLQWEQIDNYQVA